MHKYLSSICAATLAACGAGAPGATGDPAKGASVAKIPIKCGAVEEGSIERTVTVSGSFEADEDAVISAKVDGSIVRLSVDLGDRVKRGDVLARIDPDEYRLRHAQAKALAEHARGVLERAEGLARSEMVSPQALDDARSNAAQAQATAALAEKRFIDATVSAPFAGAIAKRSASEGEFVRAGQALFRLVKTDTLKLRVEVPERYVALIRVGDIVRASAQAYAGQPFEGTIVRIAPAVNAASRTFVVEARIPNADGRGRPGMFAEAGISLGRDAHALLVPERAVMAFAGASHVFHVDGQIARQVPVEVGERVSGARVEVRSDRLKAGDAIAIEGLGRLSDGAEVEVR